jgi:hypothetical protein
MTVILVDLADDRHDWQINGWNWRPILALLREAELISDEQLERMGSAGCGGQLGASEALKAAAYMRREILPRMKDGERIHANGQISTIPPQPRLISTLSSHEHYAARKSSVEAFVTFCETCAGFNVV